MNVISKSFRIRINRAAHDQALRHEQQLREAWTAELSVALEKKATYDQMLAMIVRLESGAPYKC